MPLPAAVDVVVLLLAPGTDMNICYFLRHGLYIVALLSVCVCLLTLVNLTFEVLCTAVACVVLRNR